MDFISLLFIAIGLSMDAFAVSITSGFIIKRLKVKHALLIAVFFGGFQAIMPVIGWLAGLTVKSLIENVDHWIAFGLLAFIGGKMIYESFKLEQDEKALDPLNILVLFMLAIATSIDALAVGLTFAFLKIKILTPIVIIGCTTFIISFIGVYIGDRFGHFFEKKMEFLGGLILIGIGLKILIEHLFFQ